MKKILSLKYLICIIFFIYIIIFYINNLIELLYILLPLGNITYAEEIVDLVSNNEISINDEDIKNENNKKLLIQVFIILGFITIILIGAYINSGDNPIIDNVQNIDNIYTNLNYSTVEYILYDDFVNNIVAKQPPNVELMIYEHIMYQDSFTINTIKYTIVEEIYD